MNTKNELLLLRTFAVSITAAIGIVCTVAFKKKGNTKFDTIDVKRINIVENDGTVKMLITNSKNFPSKGDEVNGHSMHKRTKRAGMLFFNEEGIECGGFIYDGRKTENGHSAGMALSYDQYRGDQVMQLISRDSERNGRRRKSTYMLFNDRNDSETNGKTKELSEELEKIKDKKLRKKKKREYIKQGYFNGIKRVALGTMAKDMNGLVLFDSSGKPKAKFAVDSNNKFEIAVFDENGKVTNTWPEKKN